MVFVIFFDVYLSWTRLIPYFRLVILYLAKLMQQTNSMDWGGEFTMECILLLFGFTIALVSK